jgi:hypothetical protein
MKVMISLIYIMLMRLVYLSVYNLAKPSLFEEIFAIMILNLNSGLLCPCNAMLELVINCHLL